MFFLEKSLKVSLFTNISLIHNELQNDTSKYIYKEVSLKYHYFNRSIMISIEVSLNLHDAS